MSGGMPQYAINLYLEGQSCVVVGGGPIAARKVEGLLQCGASVTVVAPSVCGAIEGWATRGEIAWNKKRYEPSDLDGAFLAITATSDPTVNRKVYLDGEAARVLVNSADDPSNCRFTLPSIVRRGDLTLAISTRGRSPALAKHMRRVLGRVVGPEYEQALEVLASVRDELRARGVSTESLGDLWGMTLDDGRLLALVREGKIREARALLLETLHQTARA
jgi:precorrin-2 dehydrogenase